MKQVLVTALAFYGGARRYPGDVIDVQDDEHGSWFEPMEGIADMHTGQGKKQGKKAGNSKAGDDLV